MAIFRNSTLEFFRGVTLLNNAERNFIVRSRITLQAATMDCSEAAVHSHPFFFIYRYYYATTGKLKSTITRHQNLAAPGNDKKM